MTAGNTGYVPPKLPQTLVNNLSINNSCWNGREFPRAPLTRRNLVPRIRRRIDAASTPNLPRRLRPLDPAALIN